jgi:hypothetical protein
MTGSFLRGPSVSPQARALYDEDLADSGYVWNVSRLWAHQPDTLQGLPMAGLLLKRRLSEWPGYASRGASQARAAAVSALMPVRRVWSMTGANSGE